MDDQVSLKEFVEAEGLGDWRLLSDGANAFYRSASLAESVAFARAISEIPGIERHPPDMDIRQDGVTVRLISMDEQDYGPSRRDIEVARAISAAARDAGVVPDISALQSVLVVPGAAGVPGLLPFWRAALGYVPRPDSPQEDLVDPRWRGPAFWFEEMQETRPGGYGAIHLAVWVPIEEAQARVDAALAAGGRIVRDEFAPSWWTLADAAGNEVDISTVAGRD